MKHRDAYNALLSQPDGGVVARNARRNPESEPDLAGFPSYGREEEIRTARVATLRVLGNRAWRPGSVSRRRTRQLPPVWRTACANPHHREEPGDVWRDRLRRVRWSAHSRGAKPGLGLDTAGCPGDVRTTDACTTRDPGKPSRRPGRIDRLSRRDPPGEPISFSSRAAGGRGSMGDRRPELSRNIIAAHGARTYKRTEPAARPPRSSGRR